MLLYNHNGGGARQKEEINMVAIFKNEFNHPFYAVANTKKEAIKALYDRFATEEQQKWLTPTKWWKSLTDRNGIEPFIIRKCEML